MKNVWIINHYACPDGYGAHTRQHFIARVLAQNGYNVTVFASSSNHLLYQDIEFAGDLLAEDHDGVKYYFLNTRPYNGNGVNRLMNFIDFSLKLKKVYKSIAEPPDVIWVSSPQPFTILNGIGLKKVFNCKFIFEERDIWPLTFIHLNGMNRLHPVVLLFRYLQIMAYKKSDTIVSPLDNLEEFINESGVNKRVSVIPQPLVKIEVNDFEHDFDIPQDKVVIGYVGSLGKSNSIMNLIKAAAILDATDQFFFLIIGGGEELSEIKEFCSLRGIKNIHLAGKVEKAKAIYYVKQCNILYCGNPEVELYKYGVASIKIVEYLWCGKPVIHATNAKNDIVLKANAGVVIEPENEEKLVEAIKDLSQDNKRMKLFSKNGKRYVEQNLGADSVSELILNVVNR